MTFLNGNILHLLAKKIHLIHSNMMLLALKLN